MHKEIEKFISEQNELYIGTLLFMKLVLISNVHYD